MAAYYLDASAAIKGYAAEQGSRRLLQLIEEGADHALYLSWVGVVEVAAALFGKAKTGELEPEQAASAVALLREDASSVYRIVEVDSAVAERAIEVADCGLTIACSWRPHCYFRSNVIPWGSRR
ncbi:MAG: type II toxin-antitoxin system VapC family toxin [Actinomycetota bacterium]|nr:type II toxin-antitoxin system VapC family toxin [Actinomycetota bacterium]